MKLTVRWTPMVRRIIKASLVIPLVFSLLPPASAEIVPLQQFENFDSDPKWDEHNNRIQSAECRETRQDFGWSPTPSDSGGVVGSIGGYIQPAADLCYYGKPIEPRTLEDRLSASGLLRLPESHARGHFHIGFFNHRAEGWRTPHSIHLRIIGRGNCFFAYLGYMTAKWRAGEWVFAADGTPFEKQVAFEFPVAGAVHEWSIEYDPTGNEGGGTIHATLGGRSLSLPLDLGQKPDGAVFDRFGLQPVMKSNDDAGSVWLDAVTINGQAEDLSTDPGWEGHGNRRQYRDCIIRPFSDFGYSSTNHTGGAPGEMGGRVFRGDWRNPRSLAYYGTPLEDLDLRGPLIASGKIAFLHGSTDAGTLFGFFHSKLSLEGGNDCCNLPQCFLGVRIDGPSREGFYFSPVFRGGVRDQEVLHVGPKILPDGTVHDWRLEYHPPVEDHPGRVLVALDGEEAVLELSSGALESGGKFDRFGIVTTQIDGNHHLVYLDEVEYTRKQEYK